MIAMMTNSIKIIRYFSLILVGVFISGISLGQNNIDELHGERKYRKQGLHNGNLVETLFWNFGEVAWWGKQPSGVWPKGTDHSYMDGIYPLVAAEVELINGDTIHVVEGGYREHYESGPTGVEYGWQPLPGFTNPDQDYIAMSDDPTTWPEFWPDKSASWGGKWNGYFGQRTNADQESYFVMDDYQDKGRDFRNLFYSDSTDSTRGGLGMRVGVRGFQWSNVLAEDIIIWQYDITNISDHHYDKAVFGMYADAGVGGQNDSNDDNALYDLDLDLAYTWDSNELGQGGWETGYCGYVFLESPGNQFDGIDNDGDAAGGPGPTLGGVDFQNRILPDEVVVINYQVLSPDNNWGREVISYSQGGSDSYWEIRGDSLFLRVSGAVKVFVKGETVSEKPFNGIDDDLDGIIDENQNVHTGLKYRNWIEDTGFDNALIDESRDDGIDNDGDWDPDLDDTGADGVAGTGDRGEGDGLPTGGEANFDETDKDESDQIGLTAFDSFFIGSGVEFRYDEVIWERVANYHFDTGSQNGNIAFLFGSGPFILPPNHTERFSLGLVFGENLDDLRRNSNIVQDIYNANYNFARPPQKPEVTVVPSDEKVTLYWDDAAEESFDGFMADQSYPPEKPGYDFEGYRIYKATDAAFNDTHIITNGYGEATFFDPVAQYDRKNGIKGFFDVDVNGVEYFLGDDTGLKHSWTDTDVQNGKTYYYTVVAYDRGWEEKNILPSECSKVIVRDISGDITLDKNTVKAVPNAPVAGYIPPEVSNGIQRLSGFGTGEINVDIIDPRETTDSEYILTFDDTTYADSTTVYSLFELNTSGDTLPIFEHSSALKNEDTNPLFSGMRLSVKDDSVAYNNSTSGWISGETNLDFFATLDSYWDDKKESRRPGFPTQYEIRIGVQDTSFLFGNMRHETNFQVWDLVQDEKVRFYLREPQGQVDSVLTGGDDVWLWLRDGGAWRKTWTISFVGPEDANVIQPSAGDTAFIGIDLPFRIGDTFYFKTFAAKEDKQVAKKTLDEVAVVPNPYVAAASWEPPRLTSSGRGERRISFIHLPRQATVRIYSMSGSHVKTLHHNSTIDDGALTWDLRTKDGLDLAPGVYLFHVDAGGVGETTGKFAVIK